jgi:acyl-CoA reductase-like NAD-dependent aldehyde dehydrogenase
MKVAGEIDTGLVHINGPTVDDEPMAAFGGVGEAVGPPPAPVPDLTARVRS